MSQVRFSVAAEFDLLNVVDFIAQKNPRAAEDWLSVVRERCQLLADHPLTGESRPFFAVPGCRSVSVGVYVIFFRPTENGVEIARVVHGSRDLSRM